MGCSASTIGLDALKINRLVANPTNVFLLFGHHDAHLWVGERLAINFSEETGDGCGKPFVRIVNLSVFGFNFLMVQ